MNQRDLNRWKRLAAGLAGAGLLSGCMVAPPHGAIGGDPLLRSDAGEAFAPATPVMPNMPPVVAQEPYPYPAMAPYQPGMQGYPQQPWGADAAVTELKQRLDRAEQALLRLDRRMQLVERNELGRMGGISMNPGNGGLAGLAPAAGPAMAAGMLTDDATAQSLAQGLPQSLPQGMAQNGASPYQAGIMPVSNPRDGTIRGSLQAAPHTLGAGNSLPSLADPQSNSQPMPSSAGQLVAWVVRYEPEKVWPDRNQLPESRNVVDVLRNNRAVTVVARGPNPKSSVFQERVKALSRYLAKVASLDTVAISVLPSAGLDANTIEILATP